MISFSFLSTIYMFSSLCTKTGTDLALWSVCQPQLLGRVGKVFWTSANITEISTCQPQAEGLGI